MFLKRFLAILLTFVLLPTFYAGAQEEKLSIIATIFPAYDFARVIAGDHAQVELLLPPGSESHSYEPTPQDIIAIQNADLFLYTGGESDHWIEEVLLSMGQQAPRSFRMMDCVSLLKEALTQSMEHSHAHEHDENCDHEHEHEEAELDEHVWTSPRNVIRIAEDLSSALSELAPEHAADFSLACSSYTAELELLDADFREIVSSAKRNLIIFGDRFPLRYFAAEYGLRYDAAFPGCSEDSEPSVRTVISLIDTVREEKIPVIFYIEFSSRRTADILAEETGAKPLLFHSCHNVSAEEIKGGVSYLSLMRHNAEVLKEALN
ncbi:MAG: zinc ABC transporter substrate-binding protein [Clostridia bacterium]|nr:zinc ABC transporter substrate-binding protein [Clostridia bacterium]